MPQDKSRKTWSSEEDQLLRYAIQKEDPHNPNPSKWTAISKHVPNRSNRDCRKRWTSNMAFTFVKGSWSPTEDAMLALGMERYGERWSLVSMVVKSRNSDQCAKRWREILDPAINRTRWSSGEDRKLIQAVEQYGTAWTKIARLYFPGRTGLAAKNRYHTIKRRGLSNVEETQNLGLRTSATPSRSQSRSPVTVSEYSSSPAMQQSSLSPHSPNSTLMQWVEEPCLTYMGFGHDVTGPIQQGNGSNCHINGGNQMQAYHPSAYDTSSWSPKIDDIALLGYLPRDVNCDPPWLQGARPHLF